MQPHQRFLFLFSLLFLFVQCRGTSQPPRLVTDGSPREQHPLSSSDNRDSSQLIGNPASYEGLLPEYLGKSFSGLYYLGDVKTADRPGLKALLKPYLSSGYTSKELHDFENLSHRTLLVSSEASDLGTIQKTSSGWLYPVLKSDSYTISAFYKVEAINFTNFTTDLSLFPRIQGKLSEVGDTFSLGERDYTLVKKVGKGGEGSIYLVKDDEGHEQILKLVDVNSKEGLRADLKAFLYLGHFYDWVPKVSSAFSLFDEGSASAGVQVTQQAFLMEELEPFVYSTESAAALTDQLRLMHDKEVDHSDISPGNVMQRKDGTPVFIDYFKNSFGGGSPFYSQSNTDEKALARVLMNASLGADWMLERLRLLSQDLYAYWDKAEVDLVQAKKNLEANPDDPDLKKARSVAFKERKRKHEILFLLITRSNDSQIYGLNSLFERPIFGAESRQILGNDFDFESFVTEWRSKGKEFFEAFKKKHFIPEGLTYVDLDEKEFALPPNYEKVDLRQYCQVYYPLLKRFELAKNFSQEVLNDYNGDIYGNVYEMRPSFDDCFGDSKFFPEETKTPELLKLYERAKGF